MWDVYGEPRGPKVGPYDTTVVIGAMGSLSMKVQPWNSQILEQPNDCHLMSFVGLDMFGNCLVLKELCTVYTSICTDGGQTSTLARVYQIL